MSKILNVPVRDTIPTHIEPYGNPDPKANPAETIEQEARRIIGGDRRQEYGGAKESFDNIALAWTAVIRARTKTDIKLDGETVALMMTVFKCIREANSHKRDNLVDGVGYLLLAEQTLQ